MDSIDKPDTNQKSTVIIRWDLLSLRSHRHACRRLRTETCVSIRIKIIMSHMYLGPAWIASINHTQIRRVYCYKGSHMSEEYCYTQMGDTILSPANTIIVRSPQTCSSYKSISISIIQIFATSRSSYHNYTDWQVIFRGSNIRGWTMSDWLGRAKRVPIIYT